jgi:DNA-binding CsgD family transcriptional regulator
LAKRRESIVGVKRDQVKLRVASRRERAVLMRRDGKLLPEIARELGVNKSTVHRLLKAAFTAVPVEAVEELRSLLGARFESIHATAATHMSSKDPEVALQASAVASRNARNQAAVFGLESSELRIKATAAPSTDGPDFSALAPDELLAVHEVFKLNEAVHQRCAGQLDAAGLRAAIAAFRFAPPTVHDDGPMVDNREPIGLLGPAKPSAGDYLDGAPDDPIDVS